MVEVPNLADAEALQRRFDELYWSHDPGLPTSSHTHLHLVVLMGEWAEALAKGASGDLADLVESKIIPELISSALRLANDIGIDPGGLLVDRWQGLAQLFGPSDVPGPNPFLES